MDGSSQISSALHFILKSVDHFDVFCQMYQDVLYQEIV